MALPATLVVECRTGGDDTAGGGFDSASAGTDRTLQNAPQVVIDNATITATCTTTVITFTGGTYTVLAGDVGNTVNMISGTGLTPGRFNITSVGTGLNGTWTLDHTTGMSGAAAVTSAKMGGAILSPGLASGFVVTGNIVYVQNVGAEGASVFSVTSSSGGVANGVLSSGVTCIYQGYTSSRTLANADPRPTIQINVSSATLLALTANLGTASGLIFDANSKTSARFLTSGTFIRCHFINNNGTTPSASTASGGSPCYFCSATNNATTIFPGTAYGCEAWGNTAPPFNGALNFINCLSYSNTGGTTDGFALAAANAINCTSVGNGRDGFRCTSVNSSLVINCHAESNTGNGFTTVNGSVKGFINCSYFGNTGGAIVTTGSTSTFNINPIAVTVGTVFTSKPTNVYQLNNTVNQGALLRAQSFPTNYPRGLSRQFLDIGAIQSQAPNVPAATVQGFTPSMAAVMYGVYSPITT